MSQRITKIKVILIGESGVGKTNLINVSIGQDFNEQEQTTFSSSFVEKEFEIDKKLYVLNIWDTIGQEKFRNLTKLFFKDSKIVILVYDKSQIETFTALNYWSNQVKECLGDDIILAIIGNKEDLDESPNDVNMEEARDYSENLNAKFRLVSAKENPKGFISFLKELLIDYINKYYNKNVGNNDKVVLDKKTIKKKKKSKC